MRLLSAAAAACVLLLAGCTAPTPDLPPPAASADGRGDAVVIAVIDYGFNPYHYDFLASQMPQAKNGDPSDDLPLREDPATWLPGFNTSGFASYGALELSLPKDDGDVPHELHEDDADAWATVKTSTPDEVHFRYIPGTKVVGYVNFAPEQDGFYPLSHGVGTTSVSVGNIHGSCPECLLVFVNGGSEEANRWVESQPWIDAQTNSWGSSDLGRTCAGAVVTYACASNGRDRIYTGSDTESQRAAVERGQQIFFSAGNGVQNDFITPNPTLLSSQEGPDWIVTVGAVSPNGQQAFTGAGKPADIANIGSGYPSAGGETVTAESSFGGTSNATPVTAGEYGRALYLLRRISAGPSRIQEAGTIVTGDPSDPSCIPEAGPDGTAPAMLTCRILDLTVHQLRAALFGAAMDPAEALTPGGFAPVPSPGPEAQFAAYGHGTLTGRLFGDEQLWNETNTIAAIALGQAEPLVTDDEAAWFVADSYCRQGIWGSWAFGDYVAGNTTLPGLDPQWPARTFYVTACPEVLGAARDGMDTVFPLPAP